MADTMAWTAAGTTGIGLASTYQLPSGAWSGAPFVPSADWFKKWITKERFTSPFTVGRPVRR